jgi:hypothetical protein
MVLGLWGLFNDCTNCSLNLLNQKDLILRTQAAFSQIQQFVFVLIEGPEKP